jgi:hypothetical protein
MENKEVVDAQAMLIKDNPLRVAYIGAEPIDWYADLGDPESVADASIINDAAWSDEDVGVTLTTASENENGALYWDADYDWTKDILVTATLASGGGDGGDGFLVYFGASDGMVGPETGYGSISVFIDEYNSDSVKVYNGNSLVSTYSFGSTMDTGEFRNWQILHQYNGGSRTLQVLCNGVHICKLATGAWTQGGNLVGVSAYTGSADNLHYCRAFSVKFAGPFIAMNA